MNYTKSLTTASGSEEFESFNTNEYLIRSNTFAEMVKLATECSDGARFLEQHYGDLYADAMWVMVFLDDTHRQFFYGVRSTGTSCSFDEDAVVKWNERAYHFTVENDKGKWTVHIEQIKGEVAE